MSFGEKAFELSVILSAVDKISNPLKQMTQGMKAPQKEIDNLKKAMSMMQKSLGMDVNKIMDDLRKLETQKYLKSMEKDLKAVGLKAKDIDNLAVSFENLYQKQKKAADALSKIEKGKDKLHQAASTATKTAAAGYGMYHMAEKAGDLEMMQIQYGSVYGYDKNSAQVRDMVNRSRDLSSQTLFSQKDIEAINLEMAHGGVKEDVMKNVLNPATYLAEIAVGMGKSSSAERTAYNFTSMAEDAQITNDPEKLNKLADNLYRIINVTHANDESIRETFKYGMPTVRGIGWNEDDMLLATAMASRNGMEGSMAGTHIKDFAQRLNPIKALKANNQKVLAAMQEAGFIDDVKTTKNKNGKIEITDFGESDLIKDKDHIKGYSDLVNEITAKHDQFISHYQGSTENFQKLTKEEQDSLKEHYKEMTGKELTGGELEWAALMERIFGQQGQDFALISAHKEMSDKIQQQLNQQKTLASQIEQIRDSFKGQSHILGSNLENVVIEISNKIADKLTPALKWANEKLGTFLDYMKNHPEITDFLADLAIFGTSLAALRTGFLLLDGARLVFGGGLTSLVGKWGEVEAAAGTAGKAMEGALGIASRLAGILGVSVLAADVGYRIGKDLVDPLLEAQDKEYQKQQEERAKVTDKILGKPKPGDMGAYMNNTPVFDQGLEKPKLQGRIPDSKIPYGPDIMTMDKKAWGGFVNHPVIAGEDGPEAIIPLSKRSRGIDLWKQAGQALGVGGSVVNNNITINTQPGQSPQEIAQEVLRQLGKASRNMAMNTGINVNIGAV